jgi:hypothetical protein
MEMYVHRSGETTVLTGSIRVVATSDEARAAIVAGRERLGHLAFNHLVVAALVNAPETHNPWGVRHIVVHDDEDVEREFGVRLQPDDVDGILVFELGGRGRALTIRAQHAGSYDPIGERDPRLHATVGPAPRRRHDGEDVTDVWRLADVRIDLR